MKLSERFAACKIDGCEKASKSLGMCQSHYMRLRRYGNPCVEIKNKRGRVSAFLTEALNTETDLCIEWPFNRNAKGYGYVHKSKSQRAVANRIVCTLAHGEPPTPEHQAAHSCNNPPCINKNHLRWATPKENAFDRIANGTEPRGTKAQAAKLKDDDVIAIRELAKTESKKSIADMYGICFQHVYAIVNKEAWAWL